MVARMILGSRCRRQLKALRGPSQRTLRVSGLADIRFADSRAYCSETSRTNASGKELKVSFLPSF
jgi:hypothetical protein